MRRLLGIFMLVAILVPVLSFAQHPCLISYYPFCGNAKDIGGDSLNGTVNGASLTKNRYGNPKHAYSFDGVNDWIEVDPDTAVDFDVNDNFTISFWVKAAVQQNRVVGNSANEIITNWDDFNTGMRRYPYSIRIYNRSHAKNGLLRFVRKDHHPCDNRMEMNPDTLVNDTTWHHAVMVKDGDTLLSYVDGIPYDTLRDTAICNTWNEDPLYFGRRGANKNPNYFTGVIDDISFYRCALTFNEIQALYCSDFTGDERTICKGDSMLIDTAYRKIQGTYLDFYTNAGGCDSIVCVHLNVIDTNFAGRDSAFICDGDSMLIDGVYRKQAGTYTETFKNYLGCDSIHTTDLGLKTVVNTVSVAGPTLVADAFNATYQWIDCNNGNAFIPGATSRSYQPTVSGNYAVIVTENGCADTSACINFTTGIHELEAEMFKVFPNPTKDRVNVTLTSELKGLKISVIDIRGGIVQSEIKQISALAYQIDLSGLPKGMYVLNLSAEEGVQRIEIVKE